MKLQLSGYFRTILLSVLTACVIDGLVNADEVRNAFAAGRAAGREKVATFRASVDSWLQVPQQASHLAGKVYHVVFE